MPVQSLLDYLKGGDTIDDALDGFPTVSREKVVDFLQAASRQLVANIS